MSQENDSSALVTVLGVGCVVVALILVGGGFLFFGRAPGSPVLIATGAAEVEYGYTLVSGSVETDAAGTRRATLRVELTEGWSLTKFDPSGAQLRLGATNRPVALVSPLPMLPTSESFELVYELGPAPAAGAPGGADTTQVLKLELRSQASLDGLLQTRTNADRSVLFEVGPDALGAHAE